MSLQEYISQVSTAIQKQDGDAFRGLITINPGVAEGSVRAGFTPPNDFDLYALPEKFQEVVKSYLKLMKSVYVHNDLDASFHDINDMVNHLNRAADQQTNWINVALINSCSELISVHTVRAKKYPNDADKHSSLEALANTINKLFKLSLNDKNLDLQLSKRRDVYFFLGALIKIYFKLNTLELAKSLEKALKGTRFTLPDLKKTNVSAAQRQAIITYCYYSGLLALDDADFVASEERLSNALHLLLYSKDLAKVSGQLEKILVILLPLRLYNKRLHPLKALWDLVPNLRLIYKENLFAAVHSGDLAGFDECLDKYRGIFLQRYLYLLVENLRDLCHLKLIKKTVAIVLELNPDKSHIVPFSAIQLAFNTVLSETFSIDSVECIMANLIYKGKIKGYLSNSNRCVVLSKVNGFPKQVVDHEP